jgi:hypothetical protein
MPENDNSRIQKKAFRRIFLKALRYGAGAGIEPARYFVSRDFKSDFR